MPFIRFAPAAALLALAGCSGSTEDVRISFCKDLTRSQAGGDSVKFTNVEQQIHRPSHAIIRLAYESFSGTGVADCYYAYDIVEETVIDHVDPLAAYATLPYRLDINGQQLTDRELLTAVNQQQIRNGKAAVEKLDRVIDDTVKAVREASGG